MPPCVRLQRSTNILLPPPTPCANADAIVELANRDQLGLFIPPPTKACRSGPPSLGRSPRRLPRRPRRPSRSCTLHPLLLHYPRPHSSPRRLPSLSPRFPLPQPSPLSPRFPCSRTSPHPPPAPAGTPTPRQVSPRSRPSRPSRRSATSQANNPRQNTPRTRARRRYTGSRTP